jgi:hypothetical protein
MSTYGVPSFNTLKIGTQHLSDYLEKKRDILMPLVKGKDNKNIMMLAYYRNPLNQFFLPEGTVVVSIYSFGQKLAFKDGVNLDELFEKCCFLSKLLEKEEV